MAKKNRQVATRKNHLVTKKERKKEKDADVNSFGCVFVEGEGGGRNKKGDTFSINACHPCAGTMLIFSVSFQF